MGYLCKGEGTISENNYESDKNIIICGIEKDKIYFLIKVNASSFDDAAERAEKYVWKKGILNPIISQIKVID